MIFAQSRTDSAAASMPAPSDKELPQIQLQDYTIIGLAKITLPRKQRTQGFREVDIQWTGNEEILQKELPKITFQFSRIKPSLFRLYDFPWLDSKLYYGSYNEAGIGISMQFKANNTLPYFAAFFQRSDGHLDNAQWTGVGLEAGLHHKFTTNQLLHVGTNYRFYKRGIWRDLEVYLEDWETQTVFWDVFTDLESRLNDEITTRIGGIFKLDEHQSAFKYEDIGYKIFGEANYHLNQTSFGFGGDFQQVDLTVSEGNLFRDLTAPEGLNEYQATLLSGNFYIRQTFNMVTAEAGGRYQKSDEKIRRLETDEYNNTFFHPYGKLVLGINGVAQLYAGYRPGTELPEFRKDVRAIPFTDLSELRAINYKSRWEAGIDLDLISNLNFNVVSRYSTVEFLPAPVRPADSLNAIFTQGGYPGWIYGAIDEVKIQELYGKLDWKHEMIELLGWINIRNSDIRKASNFSETVEGNKAPYYPNLTVMGRLRWYFYREHFLSFMLNYVGNRYDDVLNTTELKQYLLFNARLDLKLNENFRLFIQGHNLLDKSYEEYRGFTAPGITGILGLKLNM
jgi:outer membrane receptor protein involved in Fe transport